MSQTALCVLADSPNSPMTYLCSPDKETESQDLRTTKQQDEILNLEIQILQGHLTALTPLCTSFKTENIRNLRTVTF